MKKFIWIITLFYILSPLHSEDKYLHIEKTKVNSSDEVIDIQNLDILFDEDGYIRKYKQISKNNNETKLLNEIKIQKITDVKYQIDYKVYLYSKDSYINASKTFSYIDNKWKDETIYSKIDLPKNRITYVENEDINKFTYEDDKLSLNICGSCFSFFQKNGFITKIQDEAIISQTNELSKEDCISEVIFTNDTITINKFFENTETVYNIKTNYSFINWKIAAFNFLIIPDDFIYTPFILGFGNGFEFKEGVDYSGETKEVKKNDETVEVVQPENTNNNKPIIYAASTLIIIILASVLIIVFKKKKNH